MPRPDPVTLTSPVYENEVAQLSNRYGAPMHRHFEIELDDYMLATRHRRRHDRRAEVLFAVTQPSGKILLHTKHRYPPGLFRLFTGGIGFNETVECALAREVEEETGLECQIRRFLALCTYTFVRDELAMPFATYLFHLTADGQQAPTPRDRMEVFQIGEIALAGLPAVAARLRALNDERRVWGSWRAIGHDLVYETMNKRAASC